jgi:hypothetical protein
MSHNGSSIWVGYLITPVDRLQCGHLYCHQCLVELFESTKAEALWSHCPVCEKPIFDPPRPDDKIASAVFWLLLALGDQPTDEPDEIPADSFDIYFWR